ncbi:MAG: DNA primase [Patescibacteria group bacterium]
MGENQIEEIKNKLDIVSVVGSYIKLTKAGRHYKASCPFHSEKTPSFIVSPELNIFKCFGCQKAGDIFEFVKEFEHVEFVDALEILAEKAGIKLIRSGQNPQEKTRKTKIFEANLLASEFYNYILTKHKFGKTARDYLKDRGIKDSTIKTFQIGYAPKSWNSLGNFLLKKGYFLPDLVAGGLVKPRQGGGGFFDMFRGRIMFPLKDIRGRVIGFAGRTIFNEEPKYINTAETEIFKKEAFLFGLNLAKDAIKKTGVAIVVEGEFDMISPFQAGVSNIVASKGTSLTQNQISLIKNLSDTVILFFDTDFAGKSAAVRGIELAQNQDLNVKIGVLPAEFKDPDEAVRKDKKVFFEAIKNAVSIYDFYLDQAQQTYNLTDAVAKKKAGIFVAKQLYKIKNPIEKEHYAKKLATLLDTSLNSIWDLLKDVENQEKLGGSREFIEEKPAMSKLSPQEFIIAVLLKCPTDTANKYLYKLGIADFEHNETLKEIFTVLKDYLATRKRPLDIRKFISTIQPASRDLVLNLYLLEIENILEDSDRLQKVLNSALEKTKQERIKRELSVISGKIKEAEVKGNLEEIKTLSHDYSQKICSLKKTQN